MAKYKLFTHTDLDGVGCAIVAYHMLGKDNVDVTYCDYGEINGDVTAFIYKDEYEKYDFVFITDISVNEDVAELIENVRDVPDFRLIDHHGTALHLNDKYEWAHVQVDEGRGKASGTTLLNKFIRQNTTAKSTFDLEEFTEKVRRYDTWEWHTKYNDQHAKQLNDLLYIIGRDRFVERFTEDLSLDFTESEALLLEIEAEKIERYVESKNARINRKDLFGYKFGIVFAEQFNSELGNRLGTLNPDLDVIAMIKPEYSISFRTVKDNVDVSAIAKQLGGGGHPKASGAPTRYTEVSEFIEALLTAKGER